MNRVSLQHFAKLPDQIRQIETKATFRVRRKVRDGLLYLKAPAPRILSLEMVESDCRLDQTLAKLSPRALEFSPKVFPHFVGFKVPAGVKKIYAFGKPVVFKHGVNSLK